MNEDILFCLGKIANAGGVIQLILENHKRDIPNEVRSDIIRQISVMHTAKECASFLIQAKDKLENLKEGK